MIAKPGRPFRPWVRLLARAVLGSVAMAPLPRCTAVLDLSVDQCHVDADCSLLAAGAVCDVARRVCTMVTATQAATEDAATKGRDANSADPFARDAGLASDACEDPAGFRGVGCYRCAASTREQFLNACTTAQCTRFDEDTRLVTPRGDGGAPALDEAAGALDGAADSRSPSTPGAPFLDASLAYDDTSSITIRGGSSAMQGPAPDADAAGQSERDRSAAVLDCAALPYPVYISGSSAIKPFLSSVARSLARSSSAGRATIVYQSQGSCAGVDALLHGTPIAGVASYWDSASYDPTDAVPPEHSCNLDAAGTPVDIGVSDVFATSCFSLPQGLPATLADSLGPVQTMAFVVPVTSSQQAISAEAAYRVFGLGADSGVAPWTQEEDVLRRASSSGTQTMIGETIGLAAERWRGQPNATSEEMVAALRTAGADANRRESAIGILGGAYLDTTTDAFRVLGFQDRRQACAFWPDSTPSAKDKRNVRDGHYPMWGPLHLFTRAHADGRPANAVAASLASHLAGAVALPDGATLLSLYAKSGLVPMCAMKVSRAMDGGPLHAYSPAQPCGCYFDNVTTGTTSCGGCQGPSDCPSDHPQCSYGYCESSDTR